MAKSYTNTEANPNEITSRAKAESLGNVVQITDRGVVLDAYPRPGGGNRLQVILYDSGEWKSPEGQVRFHKAEFYKNGIIYERIVEGNPGLPTTSYYLLEDKKCWASNSGQTMFSSPSALKKVFKED